LKTEEIISNYVHKFKIPSVESQLEIVNPRSSEEIHNFYNETSLNEIGSGDNSIENSLI
jgi:hypothetical protein